jgi:hypothetical protein
MFIAHRLRRSDCSPFFSCVARVVDHCPSAWQARYGCAWLIAAEENFQSGILLRSEHQLRLRPGKSLKVTWTKGARQIPDYPTKAKPIRRTQCHRLPRPSSGLRKRRTILERDSHAPARARYKFKQVKHLYRYGHFLGETMKGSVEQRVGTWLGLAAKAAKLVEALIHIYHMLS